MRSWMRGLAGGLARLIAGGIAVLVFTLPPIVFSVAAFRPGQNPDVTPDAQ